MGTPLASASSVQPSSERSGRRRRVTWTAADQALSSLTNFALGIVVAREANARDFGAFGIAFTTYLLVVGISRSLCTDALLIRYSAERTPGRRSAARNATGAALALSFPMAGACAVAGVVLGGELRAPLLALALVLPGLVLQDAYRFSFFALGTPARAATNDLAWALGQLIAFAAVFRWVQPTPATLIIGWGGAATLAAVLGRIQTGQAPRTRRARRWITTHFDLGGRYFLDFLGVAGSVQLTVYGLGLVAGLRAAGSLRAAWLLLGPINTVFLACLVAAVPEGVRMTARLDGGIRHMCRMLAVVLSGAALAWVAVMTLVPDRLGTAILGDTWEGAQRILPLLGLAIAATGVLFAADIGLRSLADARRGLRARLTMLPLTVVGGLGGAMVDGVVGSVIGLLVANCIGSAVFWCQFSRAVSDSEALGPSPTTEAL